MIEIVRNVDLASYLPLFMQGYTEVVEALKAENPEFRLFWEAVQRLLNNEFIETADEYGISRREELLGILPSKQDTLESRRSRVQSLWWNPTPYSIRAFVKKISELCDGKFEVDKTKLSDYYLGIVTHLNQYGQTDNLRRIVTGMTPENMVVDVLNEITTIVCAAVIRAGTVVSVGSRHSIDNDVVAEDEIYLSTHVLVGAMGEIYEECAGNFGRNKAVQFADEPLSAGTATGYDIRCILQEGGNRDQKLETGIDVGTVVGYGTAYVLQLSDE